MVISKINLSFFLLALLMLLSLLFSGHVKSVPANFHGTLIGNPPCNIDSVDVEFGEMGISQIDGDRYKKPFTVTVTCDNTLGESVSLYLGYEGMAATFNSDALQTSKAGLGIIMYHEGEIIPPNNQDIPVRMSNGQTYNIDLEAVPIKDSTPPTEGAFNATGRIEIRYP